MANSLQSCLNPGFNIVLFMVFTKLLCWRSLGKSTPHAYCAGDDIRVSRGRDMYTRIFRKGHDMHVTYIPSCSFICCSGCEASAVISSSSFSSTADSQTRSVPTSVVCLLARAADGGCCSPAEEDAQPHRCENGDGVHSYIKHPHVHAHACGGGFPESALAAASTMQKDYGQMGYVVEDLGQDGACAIVYHCS